MYCNKCGADSPEQSQFCTRCGNPMVNFGSSGATPSAQPGTYYNPPPEQPAAYYNQPGAQVGYNVPADGYPSQPPAPEKPKRLKAMLICAAVFLVIAGGVILTLTLIYNAHASRYNAAVDLMSTDPAQAKTEFVALGDFADSADKAQLCQNMTDYSAAKALMDAGNYTDAKPKFDALGSYGDSVSMAEQCKNHIDYNNAASLKEAGKTEDALSAFKSLGSFLDSEAQAADCQNILDYAAAKAIFDSGDYANAKTAFTDLGTYKDSADRALSCDYAVADAAFKAKNFYTAYNIFTNLGDYKDSPSRASKCIQPYPKTGKVYLNPDYKDGDDVYTFKAPNDGYYTYIKIYTLNFKDISGPDILVCNIFIAPGGKVKIKLPMANLRYIIKQAYGNNWFGDDEMFGDDGHYIIMAFNNDGEVDDYLITYPAFFGYYKYTITLRTKTGISGKSVSRADF